MEAQLGRLEAGGATFDTLDFLFYYSHPRIEQKSWTFSSKQTHEKNTLIWRSSMQKNVLVFEQVENFPKRSLLEQMFQFLQWNVCEYLESMEQKNIQKYLRCYITTNYSVSTYWLRKMERFSNVCLAASCSGGLFEFSFFFSIQSL